MGIKKMAWFWLISLAVGLYTTFVIQNLWNWFVAVAFHVSSVSYWEMFGLLLLARMFFDGGGQEFLDEHRWATITTVVNACVPEGKQQSVEEGLKEQESVMWIQLGGKIFGKFVGSTVTLVIGWVIHVLLA